MVVIDTGVKGSTKQAVEDVHQLCDNDKNYMQVVEHIGSLVYSEVKRLSIIVLIN